jgi:hypothetical protein
VRPNHTPTTLIPEQVTPKRKQGEAAKPNHDSRDERAGYRGEIRLHGPPSDGAALTDGDTDRPSA